MELEKIAKQLGKTPAQLAREAILNHLNSDKPAEGFWLLSKPDGSSPEQLLTTKAA